MRARRRLKAALLEVAQQLAQAIVTAKAPPSSSPCGSRAADGRECRLVAYAIAHSPLVKTAFFASDPNLGRILAAVGYAGIADLDQTGIDLFLDDVHVWPKGGRNPAYREEDGQRVMKQARSRCVRWAAARPRHRLDLRPEPRLREHQRRLPFLNPATRGLTRMNEKFEHLMLRAEQLIARIEAVLPQPLAAPPDWDASIAWRYRRRSSGHGVLEPVRHVASMKLDDLKEIEPQKEKIQRNTEQFVRGLPANNVLLTARGTGKSSLIKACLNSTPVKACA
jgi:hypothetical protein